MIAKLKIELPDDERGLAAGTVRWLDRINRKLLRADLRPNQRADLIALRLEIERRPHEQRERRALEARIEETLRLAEARGEDVSRKNGPRILSRGAIAQAYEDGYMSPGHGPLTADDLHDAAKLYRDAYEAHEGRITGEKGGGGGFSGRGPQVRVLEAGAMLKQMRAVLNVRQIAVLDMVCGEGIRLRTTATVLRRGFPSTVNSLKGGLRAIAELKVKRPRYMADEVRQKTEAIARAARTA